MRKWKPSKSAKREFAQNMQNPEFANAYYARKEAKTEKRRSQSNFDYETAGGEFVPTKFQGEMAHEFLLTKELSPEQFEACNIVFSTYGLNEKVNHDYIHIVNELIRTK